MRDGDELNPVVVIENNTLDRLAHTCSQKKGVNGAISRLTVMSTRPRAEREWRRSVSPSSPYNTFVSSFSIFTSTKKPWYLDSSSVQSDVAIGESIEETSERSHHSIQMVSEQRITLGNHSSGQNKNWLKKKMNTHSDISFLTNLTRLLVNDSIHLSITFSNFCSVRANASPVCCRIYIHQLIKKGNGNVVFKINKNRTYVFVQLYILDKETIGIEPRKEHILK